MNGMNVLHRVWSFTYSCWWMDGRMAAWLVPGRKNHFAPDVGQSDINYSQHYTTVGLLWQRVDGVGQMLGEGLAGIAPIYSLTRSFSLE